MIFARLVKVDEQRRTFTARATDETPDRQGEAMDYRSSLPFFRDWSAEIYEASGGRSFGNLRSMHSTIAAGIVTNIDFNDAERAIDVECKVVDDQEWRKLLSGTYAGLSIGGSYVKRWQDTVNGQQITKYTAKPAEISLVDRPANPAAKVFQVFKRDGSVERVAFLNRSYEMNQYTPAGLDGEGRDAFAKFVRAAHAGTPGDEVARHYGDLSKDANTTPRMRDIAAELRKLGQPSLTVRADAARGLSKSDIDRLGAAGIQLEDGSFDANGIGRNSLSAFAKAHSTPRRGNPLTDADDSSVNEPLDEPSPRKKRKIKAAKRKKLAGTTAKAVGASKGMNERQIERLSRQIEAELSKADGGDDDDDIDEQSTVPNQRTTQGAPPQSDYFSSPSQQYIAAPSESQPTDRQLEAFKTCLSRPQSW